MNDDNWVESKTSTVSSNTTEEIAKLFTGNEAFKGEQEERRDLRRRELENKDMNKTELSKDRACG